MHTFLTIIRWFFGILLALVLWFVVLSGIPSSVVARTFTQADTIPRWLLASGVYENVLDVAIDAAVYMFTQPDEVILEQEDAMSAPDDDSSEAVSAESSPQADPLVQDAPPFPPADSAPQEVSPPNPLQGLAMVMQDENSELRREVELLINPGFLQANVEAVVYGVYDWLEGKTQRPEFAIVFVEDKETLLGILEQGFREQLAALPVCGSDDVSLDEHFNPFEASCVPVEFDQEAFMAMFITEFTNSADFDDIMAQTRFSSDQLDIDEEILEQAPQQFRMMQTIPYMFALLFVLLFLLVVFIVPGWKKGFVVAGISLLLPGLTLIVMALALRDNATLIAEPLLQQMRIPPENIAGVRALITPFAEVIANDILRGILLASIGIAMVGIAAIIGSVVAHKAAAGHKKEK